MDGIFALSLNRLTWLGARQTRVIDNIANVNTPNFKARDVSPFSEVVASLQQARASNSELSSFGIDNLGIRSRTLSNHQSLSGNTVDLDDELSKLSDNSKNYAMATGITRSYQRLVLASLKGVT